jgi:Tol biopolymer transport system component
VNTPAFSGRVPVVSGERGVVSTDALGGGTPSATVLGVGPLGISLLVHGQTVTLDPFKGGTYIWPSLSPDGTMLVAYEVDRGTFVCTLDGTVIRKFRRLDHPSWTRDGKWIVYMNDRDDGEKLLSSDLAAISLDGAREVSLTATSDVIELNPSCSPVANQIVCYTPQGEIFLLTYEEAGQ